MINKEVLNKLKQDFQVLSITKKKQCEVAGVTFPTLQRIYSGKTYREAAIQQLIAFRDGKMGIVQEINNSI